jgi:hypothetical protein
VLLFYITGAGNIQMEDIGASVSIDVFMKNVQYITECNVRSVQNNEGRVTNGGCNDLTG